MRAFVALWCLTACGRTALFQEPDPACGPGFTPGAVATLQSTATLTPGTTTLLARSAVEVLPDDTAQFYDWKGARLANAITLPARVETSASGDTAAIAWRDAKWHVARLSPAGLEPFGDFDGERGTAAVLEVGAAVQTAISGDRLVVHVLGGTSVELGAGNVVAAASDGDQALWIWSPRGGPTWLTRLSRSGDRTSPDVRLDDAGLEYGSYAAAFCGNSIALARSQRLSQTPLRSRLTLTRVSLDGIRTELGALAPEDRYSWMPALWCDGSRVATAWVENLEGAAGGLVVSTRLRFDDGTGGGAITLDETPERAAYWPRLQLDGTTLVTLWTTFGADGYATQLMKLPCTR